MTQDICISVSFFFVILYHTFVHSSVVVYMVVSSLRLFTCNIGMIVICAFIYQTHYSVPCVII